jgi:hypothetical protein
MDMLDRQQGPSSGIALFGRCRWSDLRHRSNPLRSLDVDADDIQIFCDAIVTPIRLAMMDLKHP